MYNYQAALYKARHEQQYRCFKSNLPAYSVSLRGFTQLSHDFNTFPRPTFDGRARKCKKLNGIHQDPLEIQKDCSPRSELKIKKGGWKGETGCTQGNGCKNVATCDTKIYSATGLEGGTELALPDFRS